MDIKEYSKYSFIVIGDLINNYKEQLKTLGGKYTSNFNGKSGWIFSNRMKNKIVEFIYDNNPVKEKENYYLEIEKYFDNSIVVYGDTNYYKEELKELGGKFYNDLNINGKSGWLFYNKSREKLEEWIKKNID